MNEKELAAEEENLNHREERFCLAFVNTGDKYKAFDIAKYEAKTQGAKAAAVSRLLKRPRIKARIAELQREYMLALGATEERILGNLAEIAFNKKNPNADRNRALELLGKNRAMWIDRTQAEQPAEQIVLDEKQKEEARRIAQIRLRQGA